MMVVLYHYTTFFDAHYADVPHAPFSFDIGYYGVHLFFLVSGFVIYMSLHSAQGSIHFAISRATRLFPAYWVSVTLTAAALALLGLPDRDVSPAVFAVNLSMLQEFFDVRNLDGAYWTLAVELAFYGWMIGFARLGLLRHPQRMFVVWVGINIVVIGAAAMFQLDIPRSLAFALLLFHGNLFFAGICFYRLRQHPSPFVFGLILVTLLIEWALRPDSILINVAIYTVFALVAFNCLQRIAVRPLLYLGAVSYPLYLIHQYIGYIVMRQLYEWNVGSPLLVIALTLVFILALAALIHHAIEVPALRILRARLLSRPNPNPTPIDEPTTPTPSLA